MVKHSQRLNDSLELSNYMKIGGGGAGSMSVFFKAGKVSLKRKNPWEYTSKASPGCQENAKIKNCRLGTFT